ncbi:hypothetical protein NOBGBDLN_02544 [[Clostridium] scindens]|uniref:hypothetical protein n=1 Tax=Clostridium scindens (strain JCM 10418 / VPI 12708) TaxID=29347 RepID=UPI00298CE0CF|nr:hypothetical protein [[Clostridium] scindens]WPB44585.1 hypothetical protein NOBGBDLN_02544 [[Clostridium] scindens]
MALILRNGGSQSPDRWLREPRNNHTVDENIEGYIKIGRGDASKWDGFVILSDGMKDKFRTERKFLRMMNRMTEDGNFQMKRLGCEEKEEGNRRDDFSIIVMERANLANCGIYMESFV